MPVEFDWGDEAQTYLRFTPTSPWNWTDFHRAMRRATFWLDSVDHPIEIIIDLRQSDRLPGGALGHIRSLGVAIHPNSRDRAVIIGLDKSVAGPLGGADRTYRDATRLLRFVDSDDEARAVIAAWQTDS